MNPGNKKRIKVGGNSITILISAAEIRDNTDAEIPEVELMYGASVIYKLDPDAERKYRYKKAKDEAFDMSINGKGNQNSKLTIDRKSDSEVMATMKDDPTDWTGKVTLGFEAIPGTGTAEPAAFDPIIINGKK